MKTFMDVVPKAVKAFAAMVVVGVMVGGLGAGYFGGWLEHGLGHLPLAACLVIGASGGLAMGAFLGAWIVSLGYVYADAERREMRPVLWTLIAALFPNLFGFLLYFALREPLGPRCGVCGQPVSMSQRFCSWCGSPRMAGGGNAGEVAAPTI